MASSSLPSYLFLLSLQLLAANAGPGYGSLADICMMTPYPDLCMRQMGPRLKQSRGVMAAGAPLVDIPGIVQASIQAATEAGAVCSAAFQGKLATFNNTTRPALEQCAAKCAGPMQDAMQQLYASSAALQAGAMDVAGRAGMAAANDAVACSSGCTGLSAGMAAYLSENMDEFQKLTKIAVTFMNKLLGPTP